MIIFDDCIDSRIYSHRQRYVSGTNIEVFSPSEPLLVVCAPIRCLTYLWLVYVFFGGV